MERMPVTVGEKESHRQYGDLYELFELCGSYIRTWYTWYIRVYRVSDNVMNCKETRILYSVSYMHTPATTAHATTPARKCPTKYPW